MATHTSFATRDIARVHLPFTTKVISVIRGGSHVNCVGNVYYYACDEKGRKLYTVPDYLYRYTYIKKWEF